MWAACLHAFVFSVDTRPQKTPAAIQTRILQRDYKAFSWFHGKWKSWSDVDFASIHSHNMIRFYTSLPCTQLYESHARYTTHMHIGGLQYKHWVYFLSLPLCHTQTTQTHSPCFFMLLSFIIWLYTGLVETVLATYYIFYLKMLYLCNFVVVTQYRHRSSLHNRNVFLYKERSNWLPCGETVLLYYLPEKQVL